MSKQNDNVRAAAAERLAELSALSRLISDRLANGEPAPASVTAGLLIDANRMLDCLAKHADRLPGEGGE